MKTFAAWLALGAAFVLALSACEREAEKAPKALAPNVVEVTTTLMDFQAPDSVLAGWTTFRFKNESDMVHFAVVERLPEGIGIADAESVTAPLSQEAMDLINEGRDEEAAALLEQLPDWAGEIVFTGGPGLTGPGRESAATVYLTPGTYLLECYVKTNGVFHSMVGMLHEFTVAGEDETAPPTPTLRVTLSNERGIEAEGAPSPGRHVVEVHYESQTAHENFVGHDVHLARLGDGADLKALALWMDWSSPIGLETPAPDGVTFLGGLNEMPAGETGYFEVTLEPGDYAWIAEVPAAEEKGFLKVFTVAGEPSAE